MKLRINILVLTFSLQLALFGLMGLDRIGIQIQFLRQIVAFVYLTLVPGSLILKLFRLDNSIPTTEFFLYSIGLSTAFLMFVGALINFLYPMIGISKPISEIPLFFTISIIVVFLCMILFLRKEEFKIFIPDTKEMSSPYVLSFTLLPFISIFGAYFLNYYNNNIILLMLYGILSAIPLVILLSKFPNNIYPFVIWVISISLLFSIPLSNRYLESSSDAIVEYYYANLVRMHGVWDPSIRGSHNALLRIVMLHPIHSILLKMELIDVFRIIHPLLYSFTPVALYAAFKRQTNEKIAFLAVYFFMAVSSFYIKFSRNTRTGIAELFLALFILLMTNRNISSTKRTLLSIIFALSIIVSHYGTSYLFLFSLIIATIVLFFIGRYAHASPHLDTICTKHVKIFSLNFILLYLVFAFAWYMYTASASPFNVFVYFFDNMINQTSELFTPETSYIIYALSRNWPFSVEISKDLLLIANIFITIGVMSLFWNIIKRKKIEFNEEFVALSISFFGILLATFLPTSAFGPIRVIHLCLCILAPFSVIGFIKLHESFLKIMKFRSDIFNKSCFKIFSIFLMIVLLFNSGFISEVITKGDDYSPNIIISKPRALDINDAQYVYSLRMNIFYEYEIFSSKWLSQKRDRSMKIYLEPHVNRLFFNWTGSIPYRLITTETVMESGYIFLDTVNTIRGVCITKTYPPEIKNINEVLSLSKSNKIYTNDGSEIYYR